ncbi:MULTISPECIES: OB-fold nucleic acid binding domain-containing protein [Actinomyces]|uniref:OB-fold nucleic acid binding domain-containing protein n=1 Tax=Actinomyces TaxID=1654 RepID=UPI0010A2A4EC|nr:MULTISPECIES: OB-fold nucleic acid binding domain-containing protein [Actinomyces]
MSRRPGSALIRRVAGGLRAVRGGHGDADGAEPAPAPRRGDTPIKDLEPRRRARVSGVLRAVTYRPASAKPTLVGQLYDGTGAVDLVWIGRRTIAGIGPGVRLRAEGMVVAGRTRPSIYNPLYELIGEDE